MTREAIIYMHGKPAGVLREVVYKKQFAFVYEPGYAGPAISLTLPIRQDIYAFEGFPSFFDGLLPEGQQLEGLLKIKKIDRDDLFGQLLIVGGDLVGAVTVLEQGEIS